MLLGTMLHDRYHVESPLGKGGMGAVFLAHDTRRDNMPVAIKEMLSSGLEDEPEKAVLQFRRECALLASLDHPNLVTVYESFEEEGRQYLVMEYVNGRTLDGLVRADGPPPLDTAMAWGDSILDVLEYLHGQQPPILFRDLKPNNVMVAADGGLKLIDFGIARAYVGDKTTTYIAGAGTAGYSPVEQFTGGTDPRSDLYAFGATLYTVLTGLVPPMSISMLNGEARLRAVHEVNPAVPRGVQRALDRVMALKRDDRCWDVAEARALLHAGWADTAELPETSPSTIHREASAETVRGHAETVPARPPARRSQAGGGAMLAAALVLIAATALFLWPRGAGVETFRPLYARFVSALDQRASAGALSIMAPDFQARLSPQHGVDRETFIRDQITALSELTDPKVTFEIDSVEARGGEAVVHARRQLRAAYLDPKGRHPITQDVEEDDTWKRSSDGWRWSSSTVRSDRQTMDGRPTQVLSSW